MAATLTVRDERTDGTVLRSFELEFPTEEISVRELIRERVYQEVDDYLRSKRKVVELLVRPSAEEEQRNGPRGERKAPAVDWKKQFEVACEAFEKNRILVLVGDRQAESLDERFTITRGVDVTFLRLVMLVGG